MLSPEHVTEPLPTIGFRELCRDDFELLAKWLNEDAVKEWWHESAEIAAIEHKYGPRADGTDPTQCFVMTLDTKPVGMFQTYWIKDYEEYQAAVQFDNAVGFDWLIGEPDYLGKGLGSRAATAFVNEVIPRYYPGAAYIVSSPSIHNGRSIRALEKAGFKQRNVIIVPGEDDPEELMIRQL